MSITRRLWRATLMVLPLCGATALAATLGGKLELDDEGSFFVNGQSVRSEYPGASLRTGPAPPGDIVVNQMYVHFRIPSRRTGPPIVMVHGSNHTGMTYETTPDGREGWATWFVRQGHPVYVVDQSGRGRSGFNPTPINAVRDGGGDAEGAAHPLPRPDRPRLGQLPFRAEISDAVPESPVPAGSARPVPRATGAQYRNDAQRRRHELRQRARRAARQDRARRSSSCTRSRATTASASSASGRSSCRALISIEGGCDTLKADDATKYFRNVPFISVFGDNSVGAWGVNGDQRRNELRRCGKADQRGRREGDVLSPARAGHHGQQPHDDDGQEQSPGGRSAPQVDCGERQMTGVTCDELLNGGRQSRRNEWWREESARRRDGRGAGAAAERLCAPLAQVVYAGSAIFMMPGIVLLNPSVPRLEILIHSPHQN